MFSLCECVVDGREKERREKGVCEEGVNKAIMKFFGGKYCAGC